MATRKYSCQMQIQSPNANFAFRGIYVKLAISGQQNTEIVHKIASISSS